MLLGSDKFSTPKYSSAFLVPISVRLAVFLFSSTKKSTVSSLNSRSKISGLSSSGSIIRPVKPLANIFALMYISVDSSP